MPDLPLDGITVISVEQAVAAPFATRQLADLGARVVKIERPGAGDFARGYDETVHGQSSYFVWLNRSKESLTLDLKTNDGRQVLEDLLARADVFVQNLAPGAARRLGLDAATLAARHGRLIAAELTGFGTDGPWANRKAYDLLVQAECGLVSITGTPESMAKTAVSIADIAAGMYLFTGIQSALYVRATTGRAPTVSVSLFDALAEWMGSPAYYTQYGGTPPARVGAQHATIAPYGPYTAADGQTLLIAVQNDREWRRVCVDLLDDPTLESSPDFARNSDRVRNRERLNALFAARFARSSSTELIATLDRIGVANARLNSVAQFLDHPVLAERDRWREVATPNGAIRALLPPATLDGIEPRMDPVPGVGEHTEDILRELGHDADGIRHLRTAGAI